jgi:hypothetical protein
VKGKPKSTGTKQKSAPSKKDKKRDRSNFCNYCRKGPHPKSECKQKKADEDAGVYRDHLMAPPRSRGGVSSIKISGNENGAWSN